MVLRGSSGRPRKIMRPARRLLLMHWGIWDLRTTTHSPLLYSLSLGCCFLISWSCFLSVFSSTEHLQQGQFQLENCSPHFPQNRNYVKFTSEGDGTNYLKIWEKEMVIWESDREKLDRLSENLFSLFVRRQHLNWFAFFYFLFIDCVIWTEYIQNIIVDCLIGCMYKFVTSIKLWFWFWMKQRKEVC